MIKIKTLEKCTCDIEMQMLVWKLKLTVLIPRLSFKVRCIVGNIFCFLSPFHFHPLQVKERNGGENGKRCRNHLRPLVHFRATLMLAVILSIFLLFPSPVAAAGKAFEKQRGLKGASSSWEGGCSRLRSGLRLLSIFCSLFLRLKCFQLPFRALQIHL